MADNTDLVNGLFYRSLAAAATLHLNKYSSSSREDATYEPDHPDDMVNGLRRAVTLLNEGRLKLSSLYLPSELDPSTPHLTSTRKSPSSTAASQPSPPAISRSSSRMPLSLSTDRSFRRSSGGGVRRGS
ncbi:hypothetical protein JCM8547_000028 [Rhodosporidiobolus lusitaniae]